jgi:hypothetical protein
MSLFSSVHARNSSPQPDTLIQVINFDVCLRSSDGITEVDDLLRVSVCCGEAIVVLSVIFSKGSDDMAGVSV